MYEEAENVQGDVFRKRRAAEQLEEAIEKRNEKADESDDVDGMKRLDKLRGREVAALIRPAVLEESVQMRIGAVGEQVRIRVKLALKQCQRKWASVHPTAFIS